MALIDRYIIRRFFVNFLLLFALLFLFAAGIDLILNLDEFAQVARQRNGEAGGLGRLRTLLSLMLNFQGPRVFLFYAHMHGLVAIGAMGFTLAQMYRYRELVAVLASGVSLHRLALPFLVGTFGLSVLQLLNQELVLHRVAPMVLRTHGDIGRAGIERFAVPFTDDGQGGLFQAALFDPVESRLEHPTILQRDERGRTVRRITAEQAEWDEQRRGWRLVEGTALAVGGDAASGGGAAQEVVEFVGSGLDPQALTLQRYRHFAGMLSLAQINQMLGVRRGPDVRTLLRNRYARFASVLVNLLVLAIALPSFLLREPVSLLRQSLLCALMALPALMGAAIGMSVDLPGVPPAVGVFLPVIVLIPFALGRWTFLKT